MPSLFVESESKAFLGNPRSSHIINAPPFHLTYAYNNMATTLRNDAKRTIYVICGKREEPL